MPDRTTLARLVVAALLLACALVLWPLRHALVHAWTTYDATPSEPAALPVGDGPGMTPSPRVRVVLVDGLAAVVARELPTWSALCARGISLGVDVGFPTVSLPVEVALWTGLTQQQTGVVFHGDRVLDPPLDRRGIPAQVAGSRVVAESHGYIARSLGFAHAEPAAAPGKPSVDALPKSWAEQWARRAHDAVTSDARLVFVHVLRVDDAGHRHGRDSEAYHRIAHDADAIVADLIAGAPDARWFLLSDHGHLATGGHGGEERDVRHVDACIAGPGIARARGELVDIVDVARAIADSTGARLDPASRGRPLAVALAQPLEPDQAMPPLALVPALVAIALVVLGATGSTWGVRRWWLAPWWLPLACGSLLVVRGMPTLSTPMIYKPLGLDMLVTWLPALAVAFAATWIGLARTTLARVIVAQLALPMFATAAAITASGGWPAVFGAEVAPVVPRFTAWMSPLVLMTAAAAAVVALAVLGTLVRRAIGRRSRPAPPRTAPAAG